MDTETDLEKFFGIKGPALEEAIEINRNVLHSPLMAAMDRYGPGVMYKSMDFSGLPTGAQRRLLENGIIFSGLFGILRPDDLIPNYRLKMDATLPSIGKMSSFWKPRLSPLLNRTVAGKFVWNLLPTSQQGAWDDAETYRSMVTVQFLREKDGEMKPVTHNVKPLRGQLVHHIVSETVEDAEELIEWQHPAGYVVDMEASSWEPGVLKGNLVMVKHES
jgi:cytoplasmic iron level regulating protein YaaA (DUF328/UPF0246 family)